MIMNKPVYEPGDPERVHKRAVGALVALEQRSEVRDFTGRRWHMLMHMAHWMRTWGPLRWTSEWAYEKRYGVLKHTARNRSKLAGSAAASACQERAGILLSGLLDTPGGLRPSPGGPPAHTVRVGGFELSCPEVRRELSFHAQQQILAIIRRQRHPDMWTLYAAYCNDFLRRPRATVRGMRGRAVASRTDPPSFPQWLQAGGHNSSAGGAAARDAAAAARDDVDDVTLSASFFLRAHDARGWRWYGEEADRKLSTSNCGVICKRYIGQALRFVRVVYTPRAGNSMATEYVLVHAKWFNAVHTRALSNSNPPILVAAWDTNVSAADLLDDSEPFYFLDECTKAALTDLHLVQGPGHDWRLVARGEAVAQRGVRLKAVCAVPAPQRGWLQDS